MQKKSLMMLVSWMKPEPDLCDDLGRSDKVLCSESTRTEIKQIPQS